jgi:hypothetical protein
LPDHVHDLPVCGYGAHTPHAPSCDGRGLMIACGEIVDPAHPDVGRALCRHEDAPVAGGNNNEDPNADPSNTPAGNNGGANDPANAGNTPIDDPPEPESEPDDPGPTGTNTGGNQGGNGGQTPTNGGGTTTEDPPPTGGQGTGGSFFDWLTWAWRKFKWFLNWLLNLLHTLIRLFSLAFLILLWNFLAAWWPVLKSWQGFIDFVRFLWYWITGRELPIPIPDTLPDPPPVRPPPTDPPVPPPEPEVPEEPEPEPDPEPERPEKPTEPEPTPEEPIIIPVPAGGCEVEIHWWFGRWVRCKQSPRCPPPRHCRLLWRRRGSTENWADAGIIKGGSVKFSTYMEYRCTCRQAPY